MTNFAKFLTVVISSTLLTGCAVLFPGSRLDKIERGMTTEQVRKLAGTPDINDFDETYEIWGYRLGTEENRRIIWLRFVNGHVVSKTTQPLPDRPEKD